MGLGKWKNRDQWPLSWLKTVPQIKVFGFIIENAYRSLITKNWDNRYRKFEQCIYSWSARTVPTIYQRAFVVNTFALSRVYYVASAIPITKKMIIKFEKLIGDFIWKSTGKLLRVSHDDIRKSKENGGIGLVCLSTMAQ